MKRLYHNGRGIFAVLVVLLFLLPQTTRQQLQGVQNNHLVGAALAIVAPGLFTAAYRGRMI